MTAVFLGYLALTVCPSRIRIDQNGMETFEITIPRSLKCGQTLVDSQVRKVAYYVFDG